MDDYAFWWNETFDTEERKQVLKKLEAKLVKDIRCIIDETVVIKTKEVKGLKPC